MGPSSIATLYKVITESSLLVKFSRCAINTEYPDTSCDRDLLSVTMRTQPLDHVRKTRSQLYAFYLIFYSWASALICFSCFSFEPGIKTMCRLVLSFACTTFLFNMSPCDVIMRVFVKRACVLKKINSLSGFKWMHGLERGIFASNVVFLGANN